MGTHNLIGHLLSRIDIGHLDRRPKDDLVVSQLSRIDHLGPGNRIPELSKTK